MRSRFRCRGDFCYSPWGDFFEDNTTVPPTGSFVFLQSPRGHQAYVECPFSISMYPGSCSLHGTFTCYANAPGSAPVTGTFYFVDLPCSRSAARYPERAAGQPALPAAKPPR